MAKRHRVGRRVLRKRGRGTRWPDAMILDSIDRHHGMTPQAMNRARELVDFGYIDASGTWVLTAKGRAKLARDQHKT